VKKACELNTVVGVVQSCFSCTALTGMKLISCQLFWLLSTVLQLVQSGPYCALHVTSTLDNRPSSSAYVLLSSTSCYCLAKCAVAVVMMGYQVCVHSMIQLYYSRLQTITKGCPGTVAAVDSGCHREFLLVVNRYWPVSSKSTWLDMI
jgi:hypothetical protein